MVFHFRSVWSPNGDSARARVLSIGPFGTYSAETSIQGVERRASGFGRVPSDVGQIVGQHGGGRRRRRNKTLEHFRMTAPQGQPRRIEGGER